VGNTTTCFGPIGVPSSGCNLEISYTRCVWGTTVGNTATCFGPIGGPSSGCNLEISYTRCVRGGTRSRYFSIGCHDLGFVIM
jgi:hypothetical protein